MIAMCFFRCVCVCSLLFVVSCQDNGVSVRLDFCSSPCNLPLVSLGGIEYYFHTSSKQEGRFIWRSTQQTVTFTDWARPAALPHIGAEPQNYLGNEHCVLIAQQ
ncbi:hypothetical protein B566_EDAN014202, partial [Ephemera danica]